MGNYPGAIALGWNCLGVIVCWASILGRHFEVGNCLGGICLGGYYLGAVFFQVVSPSNTFAKFNILINCLLPVLIDECF